MVVAREPTDVRVRGNALADGDTMKTICLVSLESWQLDISNLKLQASEE